MGQGEAWAAQAKLNGLNAALSEQLREMRFDPVLWARAFVPFGRGKYRLFKDLAKWQEDHFREIGEDLARKNYYPGGPKTPTSYWAVASGNATGKGKICISVLALWYLTTRPRCRGFVTAPTDDNLKTRAWADIRAMRNAIPWLKDCTEINDKRLWVRGYAEEWAIEAAVCQPGRPDSIRGIHSMSGYTIGLYDEASGVLDEAQTAAEASIATDGSCLQSAYSQPSKPEGVGWFSQCAYGGRAKQWHARRVTRFDMPGVTDEMVRDWETTYHGRDTDEWRVFVMGLPPNQGDEDFITEKQYDEASARSMYDGQGNWKGDPATPIVMGVDPARGGPNEHVIWYVAGLDAAFYSWSRKGSECGAAEFREVLAWHLTEPVPGIRYHGVPAACFIDETGTDGQLYQWLKDNGLAENVRQVGFGGRALNPQSAYGSRRAELYGRVKDLIPAGLILPKDRELRAQLCAARARADEKTDRIQLESKKEIRERGGPKDLGKADALALACIPLPRSARRRLENERRARRGVRGAPLPVFGN